MRLKVAGLRTILIGFALCAGIIVGSYGVNFALANNKENTNSVSKYKINENGQTYGSSFYAESIEAQPDLIWACGTEGESGYVKKTDLNGDMPKTPEEAIKKMQSNKNELEIPLYDKDGETVIGSFKISPTKVIELKAEDMENYDYLK